MTGFVRLLLSEPLKMTSVRMWWVLGIILVGYVAITATGVSALFASLAPQEVGGAGESLAPLVYSFGASVGYVFPVLLGALFMTGEFHHQTLTPTFLTTPRRGPVLGAKLVVTVAFGLLYGVAAMIASVGLGAAILGALGIDTALGDPGTWALIGRAVLAMGLWAAIGTGLGVLVPSQVAAIVIVLAFTQFVEPILRMAAAFNDVTATIAAYLPGSASDALVGASFYSLAMPGGGGHQLDWWQGGLVLLAVAATTAIAGYFTSWRRDVT